MSNGARRDSMSLLVGGIVVIQVARSRPGGVFRRVRQVLGRVLGCFSGLRLGSAVENLVCLAGQVNLLQPFSGLGDVLLDSLGDSVAGLDCNESRPPASVDDRTDGGSRSG